MADCPMNRFAEGDPVIVHTFLGATIVPPMQGVIVSVYGGKSVLFDYAVRVTGQVFGVRDSWVAPLETVIREALELDGLPVRL